MAMLRLRHREIGGLIYGPEFDSAIKFGVRGGMPEFEALVDEDDPLLPGLLNSEPVEVINEEALARIYVCPDCEAELKSRAGLKAHMGAKHDSHVASLEEAEPAAEE